MLSLDFNHQNDPSELIELIFKDLATWSLPKELTNSVQELQILGNILLIVKNNGNLIKKYY